MCKVNFDKIVERRKNETNSVKWNYGFDGNALKENQIPMWVADMDFEAAEDIGKAIIEYIKTYNSYGYFTFDGYHQIVIDWCQKRYNWNIKKEWISFTQGLVQGFSCAIASLAKQGENVILLTPTYYPMFNAIKMQGCQVVESNLLYNEDTLSFTIDYEDIAKKASDKNTTVALIGNPQNPTGRLYSIEEMSKLADILIENNVKIICDDIHCDIIVDKSKKYIPLASIEKYSEHTISMNAPSKTFNLAGLKISNIIIKNEKIRNAFAFECERFCVNTNILSLIACSTAYSKCEYWLDEVVEYIWNNYLYVKNYLENSILKDYIKPVPLEGSYLLFLDNITLMKEFNMSVSNLKIFYTNKCNLSLDDGIAFGETGKSFMRLNLATSRHFIEVAMDNMLSGFNKIKK